MPEIKIRHIVSVSSEDKHYPAENLTKNDGFKKWKCTAGEKQAIVVFQFEKAVEIKQIDIGNEGSAFIEVLVGKSTSTEDDYEVILVASSFMSPTEARSNQNPNRVRIFGTDQLSQAVVNQKWDRAKVICTQPFNKALQYGLSFIKFHSTTETATSSAENTSSASNNELSFGAFKLKSDEKPSLIRAGSLFEKNKSKVEPTTPITGAAAIRAASKLAEQSTSSQTYGVSAQGPYTDKDKSNVSGRSATGTNEDNGRAKETKAKSADKNETKTESSKPEKVSVKSSDNVGNKKKAKDASPPPPPAKKSRSDETDNKAKPFDRLMNNVVFVLSGFQNPERSELRDAAVEMGATYKPDWGKGCTHLICAFEKTPKYEQVSGHGYIVKKTWITDCYAQKKLLPWRKYRLGRAPTPPIDNQSDIDDDAVKPSKTAGKGKENESKVSEESVAKSETKAGENQDARSKDSEPEPSTSKVKAPPATDQTDEEWDPFADDIGVASDCDTEEEIRRFEEMQSRKNKGSSSKKQENADLYNASTDEDIPPGNRNGATDNNDLPALPDFFSGKTFLLYGKVSDRRTIIRYIVAYNGRLADYMNNTVNYVVTDDDWDSAFDQALADNSNMIFVHSAWINACHNSQKFVPHQKFAVVST